MENFQQRKFQIYHMENNYFQKIPRRYEVELLNIKKDFLHKLYSNIEFRWTSICREKKYLKIFEKNFLDYLQKFKFITINVHSLGQTSKIDKEDLNSLTVDVTICVEKQCIIIEPIYLSIISHIFNVLKGQGIIIIDTSNESILTEETILENQVKEEIRNVCMCYLQDINQNYFMEVTISAIVGYTIRRFFCPTEYFKDPSFFDFEGDCINERIIKEKFDELLKSKNFDVIKFNEIKQLAETKDINKSQHEFKVKEFIKLREIISDENKSFYLALHLKSLHVFVMKIFNKKDELTKEAKREIDFVKNYSHRCITHFYGFIKDDKTGKIIGLIYEFMSNGSLRPNVYSNPEKINEVFVLNTIIRILLGIDYLHSNKLMHRDLKPSNILIDHDFLPYISDFETILSIEDEDANFTDDIGSPLYTSPEQERGERLTSATDIYSFGLIIYFLFQKKDMFGNCGSFFFMKKITDKIYELACGSDNLEKIYSDCLHFNQENRTSAKEIINALHSEFLTFIVRTSFLNSEKSQKKQFIFENFLIQKDFEEYLDLLYILSQYEGKCDYDDALVKNNQNILKILGDANYYGHSLYDYGHYILRDYSKAVKYYELLAIKGISEGMTKLGRMYYKGKGLEKDIKEAQKYLTEAVKLNNSDAMIGLGKIYLKNPSDKSNNNVQEAIKLFEQSCELGNSYGFYYLAKLYFKGKYVEQNYEKAKEYLEESINRNKTNPDIHYLLGLMYQSGYGVTKDIKIAKDYFKKAKEINLPCKILIDFDKKMLHYFDQEGGKNKLNEDSDLINEQEYNELIKLSNSVPVNNEQPVNEIMPVNNDQPVNDIVPVNNDQPVNDIVPVNNEQPVNEIVSVNNDQPVNDIVPVNNDQPVNDIVPVNNDQPVNEIVSVNNDQDDEEEDYDKQKNTYQIQILPDKKIICTACNKEIDDNPVYFSGLPYHIGCIKCMKCTEEQNSSQDLNKLVCITPGCFFCPKHYEEYQSTKELDENNQEEYHKKNKENFIKEMFEAPLYEEENIDYNPDDEIFITPDIVKSSIPKDRPFEDFIPTVTFTFEKSPLDIDFDALAKILEEEGAVILNVDHGCTILKIAFLSIKKLSQKVVDKFHNLVSSLKNKFKSTIGKPVVGNLVEDPSITFPDDEKIMKNYNQKASVNLLQNISELSEIDLDTMKEEVLSTLHKEKVKKNWQFLFSHEDIFKMAEEHIRKDLYNNEFEMIMVAQTVIANKYIEDYEKVKNRINSGDLKIAILYHGSKLANHTKIVKDHFLDPNKDKKKQLDAGCYGKGIYATENMFYASMYANGYSVLGCNQKAPIICCLAIYNNNKIKEIKDMSWYGKKIEPEIANNYGVHHAFVGSSQSFRPVPESEKNTNWIWAEEYVFNNKFQIIPICSITLMRKDFYILWKDENIANSEYSRYLNELSKQMEINVYTKNNVYDALKIIQQKRKNKIKLITNGGPGLTGRLLIEEARKIIGSDFVCLVFAGSSNHIDWVSKMKNVLFTTSPADFRKFAAMDLNKKDVLGFINGLHYKDRFKIYEDELLSFPSTDRSKYK
ncbi:hypothetical protein M9Y10_027166 [Tritrichomonas musculus]|uniref:non-specific serine/threonine protein kinase n=1 Tax=Tritrichomonas musculus TaxID=1915356 RepID=A0ABR2H5N1_9EUKA